jgi:hypothetical protein
MSCTSSQPPKLFTIVGGFGGLGVDLAQTLNRDDITNGRQTLLIPIKAHLPGRWEFAWRDKGFGSNEISASAGAQRRGGNVRGDPLLCWLVRLPLGSDWRNWNGIEFLFDPAFAGSGYLGRIFLRGNPARRHRSSDRIA